MSTKNNILKTQGVFSSYTEQILSRHSFSKVHSVFPNGFNLNFNGEFVFISYHQTDRLSARGLTIDKNVYDVLHPFLQPGLQVRFRENKVIFYTRPNVFTIEFLEKKIKDLKLQPVTRQEMEDINLIKHLREINPFQSSGFSKNELLLNTFEEIRQLKEIKASHVKQLIGAGVGLTPSGDDFLQGFMLMEQLISQSPDVEELVKLQLKERSTTDISLSYYEALFDGYYNEDWIRLFEAIKQKDESKVKQYLSLIKDYGKTSGYDILLGILTYLQIL